MNFKDVDAAFELHRRGFELAAITGEQNAMVEYFRSRFYKERSVMNAEALTVNTSTLTAISNDYSYERIFTRQIEAKGRPGDILIGISTSGKSKSVIEALRYARNNGMLSIILMGDFYNFELEQAADYIIRVPSKITP